MKTQLFCVTFLLICLTFPLTTTAQVVDIPDPNLHAAIAAALGKASDHAITVGDMADLTELEPRSAGINNLTGLEAATNLTRLNLWGNSISDVSPLTNLINLTSLHLGYNPPLSDISPLADLTNLTWLYLPYNPISDVSPLANLTNLTGLDLSWNNALSDISSLANLTNLTFLELRHTSVSDLSPLANLTSLTGLYLPNTNISDISSLANLINLTATDLSSNTISDLSPLIENAGLGNGTEVNVRGNPLSYLSVHTHIPTLQNKGVAVYFDNQAYSALLKISGDNQNGGVGVTLAKPFVIEAQDANGAALAGISVIFAVTSGGGTLNVTSTTTEANGRAESTLTLGPNPGTNTVQVSADGIESTVAFYAIAEMESPAIPADVSGDGVVNILDLVSVVSQLGSAGINLAADVNGDGVVNILDLVSVAGMLGATAAAPSVHPQTTLTAVEVRQWLTDAKAFEIRDPIMKRGMMVLEQLLVSLTPTKTELLANYPNPFNPETWIPYRLAQDALVTLTIYDTAGQVVCTLDVGHQTAAFYESQSQAIYWDGKNEFGERVTSGVYFYHLSAGDYSATRKMLVIK